MKPFVLKDIDCSSTRTCKNFYKINNATVSPADPCPPTAVSTSVDCLSNIATITWSISNTTNFYTARAVGPDGMATTCTSSTTSCGIALLCGQKYNISVTASNFQCNSKPSSQTNLSTGFDIDLFILIVSHCKYCWKILHCNFFSKSAHHI